MAETEKSPEQTELEAANLERMKHLAWQIHDKISKGEPLNGELSKLEEAYKSVPQKALGWREALNAEPVNAEDLAAYIDQPIPYIINPLIVKGALTQIQGTQKGGKSSFSLYLALCTTTGIWPDDGNFSGPKDPVKVLYIAWEDPRIMMAKRLSLYTQGLGLDRLFMPKALTFFFAPNIFIEKGDHAEALIAAIKELKPEVVFIDTLSQIHLMDENAASEMKIPMRNLMKVAEQTGVGIVYLHHTSKSSTDKTAQDKSRGSGAIAAAWHILIDWGVRARNSNVNPVEIQSKYEQEFLYWDIEYIKHKNANGDVTSVEWLTLSNEDGGAKKKESVKQMKVKKILQALDDLGKTMPDRWCIADAVSQTSGLGLDERSIRRILQDLCAEEKVECCRPNPSGSFHYRLMFGGK